MQRQAAIRATFVVASLILIGVLLVLLGKQDSGWRNLGQALVSGGVVGSVFVFIEASLARVAEQRSARESLISQITLTTSLVGVDLGDRVLRSIYLPSKRMTAARLRRTDLSQSVLLHGDFRHADMTEAVLVEADLGGSTLQRANMDRVSARGCCFLDADLTEATLIGSDLRDADLSYALLRQADLRGADLRGARLVRSDVTGADLTGALLAGADLHELHFDALTRWPPGTAPAHSGPSPPIYVPGTDLANWLVRRAELRGR